jgi:hypothetical protein
VKNLHQQGKASNTGINAATVFIQNTTFNNNLVGTYLGMVNYATITLSTFNICSNNGSYTPNKVSGLYIDNSTGFDVQDNLFQNYGTGNNLMYGVVVNNSGLAPNVIYRNKFQNLYKGSQAQFVNYSDNGASSETNNSTGLLYLCNIFTPNSISKADIYVPFSGSGNDYIGTTGTSCSSCVPAGIALNQGAGTTSSTGLNQPTADNQFSKTPGGSDFFLEYGLSGNHTLNSVYAFYCEPGSSCVVPSIGGSSVYQPTNNLSTNLGTYTFGNAPLEF